MFNQNFNSIIILKSKTQKTYIFVLLLKSYNFGSLKFILALLLDNLRKLTNYSFKIYSFFPERFPYFRTIQASCKTYLHTAC